MKFREKFPRDKQRFVKMVMMDHTRLYYGNDIDHEYGKLEVLVKLNMILSICDIEHMVCGAKISE